MPTFIYSTTAQSIMDASARDVRQTLSSTADATILVDYVNRVSLELLRASKWLFLVSAPQRFITELGQSDYYIGAGLPSPGDVRTGLNLNDARTIIPGTVMDRSNFRPLNSVTEAPNLAKLEYPDASQRLGRPAVWQYDVESNPDVLTIYPGPDNQNSYQPVPNPPNLQSTGGSALPQRTVYVRVSFVDSFGNESSASAENYQIIPLNSLTVVNSPDIMAALGTSGLLSSALGAQYTSYNVYASLTPGNEVLQTVSPLALGSNFTEPPSGLIAGPSYPTVNNITPLQGYIIEFRYAKARTQISGPSQVLQIPDDYKDVVIAGVNAKAFAYLTRMAEAQTWYALYKDGIGQIVRDVNYMLRGGGDYIRPDGASIGGMLPAIETNDFLSVLNN